MVNLSPFSIRQLQMLYWSGLFGRADRRLISTELKRRGATI